MLHDKIHMHKAKYLYVLTVNTPTLLKTG